MRLTSSFSSSNCNNSNNNNTKLNISSPLLSPPRQSEEHLRQQLCLMDMRLASSLNLNTNLLISPHLLCLPQLLDLVL